MSVFGHAVLRHAVDATRTGQETLETRDRIP